MRRLCEEITQAIGQTSLVKIRRLIRSDADVLAKMESLNPMSSVKDRIGLAMIEAAERDGNISAGTTVIV